MRRYKAENSLACTSRRHGKSTAVRRKSALRHIPRRSFAAGGAANQNQARGAANASRAHHIARPDRGGQHKEELIAT